MRLTFLRDFRLQNWGVFSHSLGRQETIDPQDAVSRFRFSKLFLHAPGNGCSEVNPPFDCRNTFKLIGRIG